MSKIFLYIYDWFEKHPRTFYAVLTACVATCVALASQISLQENITNFFGANNEKDNAIFDNLKAKDRIIVMLSGEDPDSIISAAEVFEENLAPLYDENLIRSVTAYVDEEVITKCTSFIYDYLPIFLEDEDYAAIEQRISTQSVDSLIHKAHRQLTSPSGIVLGDMLLKDPLGVGVPLLQKLQQLSPNLQYEIYGGRLFTKDFSTMLIFIEPTYGMGNTGRNDRLVSLLEQAEQAAELGTVAVDCIGAPIVSVYNARQIKQDTALTMSIAFVIILGVIMMSLRNRRSIPLIILPPLFGGVFSLAMMCLLQKEISAIAIGAGTVILGISLSYSIHIIAHQNHTASPRQIIEELSTPLTIGSLTTIGAFAALSFTSSDLLRDMGLFSVFALVGTTLFCLVFLPHFLKGQDFSKHNSVLRNIERIVCYRYETNKWVLALLLVAVCVALFYWKDVRFNGDMSKINFVPQQIEEAEQRSAQIFDDGARQIYIVLAGDNIDSLATGYSRLVATLNRYNVSGEISEVTEITDYIISPQIQEQRIRRWTAFWDEHRSHIISDVSLYAGKYGFSDGAFSAFEHLISRPYKVCGYTQEEIGDVPAISEWIDRSNGKFTLLSRISIDGRHKAEVYGELEKLENTAVVDRAYFSAKMVETTNDDFNYILFVSSTIVFIALFLSYGRLELTLLTFLPMCISWVIILGMMALFGIEFNIVNIILATFIFGIGDDFSIFIMDGLMQEYRNGRKVFDAHKTAIFFSAFTALVGIGVLIFAQHPALRSIALISVLGLSVVVFVSYTIQPMLFRLFISSQTQRGGFPYTLCAMLNTFYCFAYFLFGCILVQLYMLILLPLPIKRSLKKASFHKLLYYFTRFFLMMMVTVRVVRENPHNETYRRPAVIIANHQSFIDILLLLSTTPKIVMLTKGWVWNSPFFGWIVQYADFYQIGDGYELLAERLQQRVAEGYSVVVFPEGTRSVDCSIQRFHRGAFYLAQLLKSDILPILIYGAGQVSSKSQGFYIKRGIVVAKTMKRLPCGDTSMGQTYQEQARVYRRWFREQYRDMNDKYGRSSNPYFRDALIKNYIYKGPVLEWYMRIKNRMENYYDAWDRIIPRDATVTDVGCGYGQMSLMLGLLSSDRTVLGIDYDMDKIEVARHSFLCRKNVSFLHADMRDVSFPQSDAILFNDSLHYVDKDTQLKILGRAVSSLKKDGIIIVRDGDASSDGQRKIDQTEMWSTKITGFNKTSQELDFADSSMMSRFAWQKHLDVTIQRCNSDSSETFYVFRRKEDW